MKVYSLGLIRPSLNRPIAAKPQNPMQHEFPPCFNSSLRA
jgi:hypothetical protein